MQTRRGCTARWKPLNVAGTKRRQAGNRQQLQLFELHLKTVQQQQQQQLWSQKERCEKVKSARIDLGSRRRRRRRRATNWFCRGSRQQAGRQSDRGCSATSAAAFHSLSASIEAAGERASNLFPSPLSLSHSPSLSVCLSLCGKIYEQRSVVTAARCAPAPMPMVQQPQMEMKMKLATQTPQLSRSFDFDLP